ncbi:type IV pilus assembly protein PilX [Massilia sp. MP_M2]|uniref:pilus assembly PilX family protein n=1 Tax=Massilia sp. MP_M2 TaxID=3071713 RepID=UPI00319EADA7
MRNRHFPMPRRQAGIALITALVLMLAVLMTGIASARGALQSTRAAAYERDRVLAIQMAEAALLDAEHDIAGGAAPGSARANAILAGSADAFVGGCLGARPYSGLCVHDADANRQLSRLADDAGPAIAFGTFTGTTLPTGEGGLPLEAPRYLIELMPAPGDGQLYRIAARGVGSMPGARAAVQAYYHMPSAGAHGRRVGWREIGNWSALIVAAAE